MPGSGDQVDDARAGGERPLDGQDFPVRLCPLFFEGTAMLREPRVETGKRTMAYMAASLAFTAGGILLPDTAKQKPQRGRVLAAGPGKLSEKGDRLVLNVKVGDEVLFGRYAGSEIKEGGKELALELEEKGYDWVKAAGN